MKSSLPKVLFVLFVIGLIGFSAYTIYMNKTEEEEEKSTEQPQVIQAQILNDLRLGIVSFDTLNPILSQNRNVQEISRLIYEPLVSLSEDNKPVPCLATEWSKVGDNGYIIKLRQSASWHDGTVFSASDVKFTIDKLKNEAVSSIYAPLLKNVTNLDIVDFHTIKLTLDHDVPFFEYYLTFPILSSKYYEGEEFLTSSKNKNPPGTGRYKASFNEEDVLVLKENKNYWGKGQEENTIKNINVYFYSTMGEAYNAFKIGNIDLITTKNLHLEDYVGTIGYNIREFEGMQFSYMCFNTASGVCKYKEVRKAISYAIDKTVINATLYNNKYSVADFVLGSKNWLNSEESPSLGYNPDQANAVLTDGGWSYKNGAWQKIDAGKTVATRLTLVVNSNDQNKVKLAENIKSQLDGIGIKVTIKAVNGKVYDTYLINRNYDMLILETNGMHTPDLTLYLGQGNYSNYSNAEINTLFTEAQNIKDENTLKEKYKKIYEIYKDEMPFLSLFYDKFSVLSGTTLMAEITPNNYNIFYNVHKWYRQY